MLKKKISVILPTYNEKDNIVPLVKAIKEQIEKYEHEIIVVDDNSSDDTHRIILDANMSNTTSYLRTGSKSLAESVRYGIERSQGEIIIVMDSDFNHQPQYISKLIDGIACSDCVTASRYVGEGKMNSLFRHFASGAFNRFINFTTGGKVKDNLYGFFAIRRKVLFDLDFDSIFIGYGDYFIRLLYALQKTSSTISEFPAINGTRRSGQGNRHLIRTFFQYLDTVLRLK